MFVDITFRITEEIAEEEIDTFRVTRKEAFWRSFVTANKGSIEDIARSADQYEAIFKQEFPKNLMHHVTQDLTDFINRNREGSNPGVKARLRVAAIEYGSLKAITEFTGIEGKDALEFALFLFDLYSPLAFKETFDTDVQTEVSIDLRTPRSYDIPDNPRNLATPPIEPGTAQVASNLVRKIWVAAGTSLLLPFLAACGVYYLVFVALDKEKEQIVNNVFAQNADMTKALTTEIGAVSSRAKTDQDLLADLVKSFTAAQKATIADHTPKP